MAALECPGTFADSSTTPADRAWRLAPAAINGRGRWWAAEVAVLEPVGVALEGDDVGVVDEAVDHRGGDGVVAKTSPHRPKGLFEVTIRDARS